MTEPVTDWRTDWDHADPAWAADPFAIWDDLRSTCPVARTERYGGGWLVTSHALIDEVTHDTATYSSRETGVRPPAPTRRSRRRSRRIRRTTRSTAASCSPSFGPRSIAKLEDGIRAYCKELLATARRAAHL